MLQSRSARISQVLVGLGLMALAAGSASAQDRRQNTPGEFDYYVLSLSWSPSFCEEASERGTEGRSQAQCGGRPFSFVVHGLWPQYERGFPEYCQRPSPRLDRNIMSSMLDLMPAPGLVFNEWDKHGTCSGLPARAYFETIRKARAAVKIPPEYLEISEPKTVAPAEIEDGLHQGQSGPEPLSHCGDLQQDPA
jgi:ribonuclease T2